MSDRYNGRECDDDQYQERHSYYEDSTRFNPKLDILDFKRRMQLDDFLNWLNTIGMVFEYGDKKIKLVAIKLRMNAFFLWENFE